MMNSIAKSLLRSVKHGRAVWLRSSSAHSGKQHLQKLVLGIETSCDDTGAAVVDDAGNVLGEALHCQKEVHLQSGGIIPVVAQQLHRENIEQVVKEALRVSGVSIRELAAVATTVKPGLALSLEVGLHYSLNLVNRYQKPFIPIHHMEAHALTVRLMHQVARRLSLRKHPECHSMAGGKAIEHLAQAGNRQQHAFRLPMQQYRNCDFSFSGLQNLVNKAIIEKEEEEGIQEGEILSSVKDIAAAVQHAVAVHVIQRTYRAMLFCVKNSILSQKNATLVVSGGVASNQYIRKGLQALADANDFAFLCPPPSLCTDNGVMVAWNGIERLRAGLGVLHSTDGIRYEPKAPLGIDISKRVEEDSIKVPKLKKKIRWLAS
ncbi:tRNA N6-adenosine threonylcarbamoyltransferase, mitochondrial isoform X5 [Cuculus canorus]|uniref:tRNA N6-adenosine threonylcarbamoyltransferase, mitochondrial isoform X5 n=1 Tax=Cuculus canorus TaxID=55661 RepID=UPI0023AB5393|nr:tRNA N6-adenosine threonylcarbamoyltransferase, mitochondrial isoform X5 [Cuculus canorus]